MWKCSSKALLEDPAPLFSTVEVEVLEHLCCRVSQLQLVFINSMPRNDWFLGIFELT